MGLLGNVLTGMMNGPRGGGLGGGFGGPVGGGMFGGGGVSPIAAGVLGLLAYKAYKSFSTQPPAVAAQPTSPKGGGLLAGTPLEKVFNPSALSGGLNDLLGQFRKSGKGDVADSWVAKGDNRPIAPEELGQVLSPEQIAFLMGRTGLSREELLAGLSQELPKAVDTMTPEGRVPDEHEMKRLA